MNTRILIADDEHLARLVLTTNLEKIDPTCIIMEAINGKDLQEKATSFLPHIAIVDIQMPLVNGLDAIKSLKKKLPMTQYLILTGFAKFDYAKEAIALQVADYMVKPIRKNQLEHFINQSLSRMNFTIDADNATFEQQLREAMKSNQKIQDTSLYQVALISLDTKNPATQAITMSHLLKKSKDIIHEDFEIFARGSSFQIDGTTLLLTISSDSKKQITSIFLPALEKIMKLSSVPYWAFSSEIFQGLALVTEKIETLRKRMEIRLMVKPFAVHKNTSLDLLPNEKALFQISTKMLTAIGLKNEEKTIIAKQEKEIAIEMALLLDNRNKRELSCFVSYLYHFYELQLPQDIKSLTFEELHFLLQEQFQKRSENNSYQIEKILTYMQEHYAEDIGVKDIASLVEISPNYLSSKFKQETGKRFLEYLTELRINRSKLLLQNSNMYIHMIAKEVGFNDVKHFSHIFEQAVGCSPSKFRESK
jgi:two-component system response regulator YesN